MVKITNNNLSSSMFWHSFIRKLENDTLEREVRYHWSPLAFSIAMLR